MQLSRVLLVVILFTHLILTDGFFISLGLVGLSVVGLAGLKVYYGMKMFGPAIRSARDGIYGNFPSNPVFGPAHHPAIGPLGPGVPQGPDSTRQLVVLPIAFNPKDGSGGVPISIKVRRDVSGGIQLSKGVLNWLKEIDDEKCLHRFFCDLGTDQTNFGNLGRITNMLIMMGGLPKGSWAQDMYAAGQDGKPCPTACDQRELSKTVDYLERHIFVPSAPGVAPATRDNEIST